MPIGLDWNHCHPRIYLPGPAPGAGRYCSGDAEGEPLHFRIIPDTKGVIFERVQVRQVEIDDLLFFGAGGITGRRRLRRDLRASGSAALIHGRFLRGRLALGLFVPRFGRLCLIGSSLVSLGRAAFAGFGGFVLFRGRLLLDRLFLLLGCLVTGGGKVMKFRLSLFGVAHSACGFSSVRIARIVSEMRSSSVRPSISAPR